MLGALIESKRISFSHEANLDHFAGSVISAPYSSRSNSVSLSASSATPISSSEALFFLRDTNFSLAAATASISGLRLALCSLIFDNNSSLATLYFSSTSGGKFCTITPSLRSSGVLANAARTEGLLILRRCGNVRAFAGNVLFDTPLLSKKVLRILRCWSISACGALLSTSCLIKTRFLSTNV